MPPILSIAELCVSFPGRAERAIAVQSVSLELHAGRTLCLVGESGSGKSVTALALMRLLDEHAQVSGKILFQGRDLLTLPEREMRAVRGGKIGMVFQEPATSLHPVRSIGSQVAEAVRLHRPMSSRGAWDEALRLLADVRLPDPGRQSRQYPHELSGGLKQRAMIAMALAGEPDLLLADEPTTALDVTVQAEILRLLDRLKRERNLGILLITHDLGVVAEMADDVAVMRAGQIVEQGSADAIFNEPKHPYTQELLASFPRIDSPASAS